MPLIKCEINLILTWSAICFIAANEVLILAIADIKLYVPHITSSTQNHAKPLQQLKSSFKRRANRNKYQ